MCVRVSVGSKEICTSGGSYLMCPLCNTCKAWNMSDICTMAKVKNLRDISLVNKPVYQHNADGLSEVICVCLCIAVGLLIRPPRYRPLQCVHVLLGCDLSGVLEAKDVHPGPSLGLHGLP